MNPIVRSVLSVIAGIVAFIVVVMTIETLNSQVYPLPADVDMHNKEAMRAAMIDHMQTLPTACFLVVLLGWELGAFVGGGACAYLAGRLPFLHAGIIGLFVFLGTWANIRE